MTLIDAKMCSFYALELCGAIVQWLAWTPGPGVQPAGVRSPDSDERYLWDALVSPTHRRRSEVGGAEPEIRSPNQKRSIMTQNAERRTQNNALEMCLRSSRLPQFCVLKAAECIYIFRMFVRRPRIGRFLEETVWFNKNNIL